MPTSPLISVLMPSYNHAAFILDAINSILNQSYRNLQLIIVDDASADETVDAVKKIKDDRIVLTVLSENVGACQAMNIGLSMCDGDFIAVCNSDDVWHKTKLEQQLKVFSSGLDVGAVFSDVEWIDETGKYIESDALPIFEGVFKQRNRSRRQWIRDLLEHGNQLCHPSVLIKREVYTTVGLYNNYYRQLPDLDMWIRVLQHYDIFIMPEKLVNFRIHENNTSKPSPTSSNRAINEHRLILANLMRHITAEDFYRTFGLHNKPSIKNRPVLEVEKATYLLRHEGPYKTLFHQLGCEVLTGLSQSQLAKTGIGAHAFHEQVGSYSPWIPQQAYIGAPVEPVPQTETPQAIVPEVELVEAAPDTVYARPQSRPSIEQIKTVELVKIVGSRLRKRLLSF